jgi:hypothetical protein
MGQKLNTFKNGLNKEIRDSIVVVLFEISKLLSNVGIRYLHFIFKYRASVQKPSDKFQSFMLKDRIIVFYQQNCNNKATKVNLKPRCYNNLVKFYPVFYMEFYLNFNDLLSFLLYTFDNSILLLNI